MRVIGTGLHEGAHIRLRCPAPDHLACVKVSAFAHSLAFCIVDQKFNCGRCDGIWILEGDQRSASIIEKLSGVPVWSRDDRLACAHGIRQCPRYSLCLVAVRRDVNVGRTHQSSHLPGTEEPIVEDYLSLHSKFPG